MNFSTITKNTSFSTLTLLAVIGAVFHFGILKLHTKIADERDSIEKLRAQEENAAKKIQRLPEFQTRADLIDRQDLPLVSILSESKVVDFIKHIEELAVQTGNTVVITQSAIQKKNVPVVSVTAKDSADTTTPAAAASAAKKSAAIEDNLPFDTDLRLNLSVTGPYPKVIQFLHKIETLPYELDVISMEIKRSTDANGRAKGGVNPFEPVIPSSAPVPGDVVPADLGSSGPIPSEVTGIFEVAVYYQGK